MPQIRTYAAPPLSLNPSETGVEATANAARLGGRLYSQAAAATQELGNETQRFGAETASVGEGVARDVASTIKDVGNTATQYIEHQEISHGATAWAGLNDQLTQAWNDTAKNADPNDPTVAQKFRENVLEPSLEKFNQGFLTEGGQRWAESHTESLRNHMFEKTSADMSTLAGTAASLNIHNTATSMSNTAVSDPSSVPHLLSSVDSVVGGVVDSSPNIKGVDAAKAKMDLTQKMRETIVKSGAFGAIQSAADPEAEAKKWATAYPDLINGQEELALGKAAKVQARTNTLLVKQTELYNRQLAENAVHNGVNDAFAKNVSIDPATNKVTLAPTYFKDVLDVAKKNPTAPNAATAVKAYLDWGESQQKPGPTVSDQGTVTDLDARMFVDGNPTNSVDILKAEAAGKLSRQDAAVRLSLVKQRDLMPNDPPLKSDRTEFFKRYAGTVDGYLAQYGIHSALGQQKMYAAQRDAITEEAALRAAGKDPRSLYDPSSPNFFGRPENIAKYHVTMQQGLDFANDKGSMNLTGPGKTVTGVDVQNAPVEKPPMEGARKAADGQWYVQKDGKYFRVKQ